MADDTRRVIITIKNGDSKPNPSPKPVKPEDSKEEPSITWGDVKKTINTVAGVTHVVQLANYAYGKYTKLTENYISQNAVANAANIIGRVGLIAAEIATGNVVAAIGTAVGTGIQVVENYIDSFEDLNQKAYDKYYQGARYGLINGNRGTEN